MSEKVFVSYEEFSKMDLRIGKIVKAEPVPGSRNLIKLSIDVGEGEIKQGVAGIAHIYSSDELHGKQVAIINNLQPKRIFGVESNVMILAAEDETTITLLIPERPVKIGSRIK
jgi:methionine--tRNA ligase beta chain